MKPSLFISNAIAISAGIVGTLLYVTTTSIPEVTRYVVADPYYIQLKNNEEPQPYSLLLQNRLLARTYISHPLYLHKRQEGYKILEKIASQGHAPTAKTLSNLYMFRAYDGEPEYFKKSYDWALTAAELGKPHPLIDMVLNSDETYKAKLLKAGADLEQGLELLESMARAYNTNYISNSLYTYYEKLGNLKKAEYWKNVAIDMYDNPNPEPVCKTLSPNEL